MKHMEEYPDEELIDMYRAGNEQAIEYIFERYKYIVRKKAKAMFLAGGDSDDLIQEGMIGLYKAVRDYDKKKDASFMTFAGMCINRQILNAVTASNRKKNTPLNTYVSFDEPVNPEDDSQVKHISNLTLSFITPVSTYNSFYHSVLQSVLKNTNIKLSY